MYSSSQRNHYHSVGSHFQELVQELADEHEKEIKQLQRRIQGLLRHLEEVDPSGYHEFESEHRASTPARFPTPFIQVSPPPKEDRATFSPPPPPGAPPSEAASRLARAGASAGAVATGADVGASADAAGACIVVPGASGEAEAIASAAARRASAPAGSCTSNSNSNSNSKEEASKVAGALPALNSEAKGAQKQDDEEPALGGQPAEQHPASSTDSTSQENSPKNDPQDSDFPAAESPQSLPGSLEHMPEDAKKPTAEHAAAVAAAATSATSAVATTTVTTASPRSTYETAPTILASPTQESGPLGGRYRQRIVLCDDDYESLPMATGGSLGKMSNLEPGEESRLSSKGSSLQSPEDRGASRESGMTGTASLLSATKGMGQTASAQSTRKGWVSSVAHALSNKVGAGAKRNSSLPGSIRSGGNLSVAPARKTTRRPTALGIQQILKEKTNLAAERKHFPTLDIDPCWTNLEELALSLEYDIPDLTPRAPSSSRMQLVRKAGSTDVTGTQKSWASRFIIAPTSRKRLLWDLLGMTCLLYDIIVVPLGAFEIQEEPASKIIAMMTTLFWTLDIPASFCTGYQTDTDIQLDPRKIAAKYIKGWFGLDAVLVVVDWATQLFLSHNSGVLRMGKSVSRSVRVLRMIRLVKLRRIVADITDRIPSEVFRTILRVIKLLVFIVLLNHYIACGWYWIGRYNFGEHDMSWVPEAFTDHDGGTWYRYTTSLHWSLTQFTPASMEVTPTNPIERTYSVCVLLFALVTFSSFVSIITGSVTQLQQIHSRKLHNQMLLRRYLSERRISAELVLRVCHFVQRQQKNMGGMERLRTKEDRVEALQMLPASIISEIRFQAYSPTLLVHPIFYFLHAISEACVKQICSRAVTEVSLSLSQELFAGCSEVNQMIYMMEGTISYSFATSVTQPVFEGRIEKDQWACEAALWCKKLEIRAPFVAMRCCDILLLSAVEFKKIGTRYPDAFMGLACYSERYIQSINEPDCEAGHNHWRFVGGNGYDVVRDLAHLAFNTDIQAGRTSTRRVSKGPAGGRMSQVVPSLSDSSGDF